MSKTQTPSEFEKQQRDQIAEQEKVISSNLTEIARLEERLAEVTAAPTEDLISEALDLKVEITARRTLAEDFRRNFRADTQFQKLLNTDSGKQVLIEFLKSKRPVIVELEKRIPALRKEAMEAEQSGGDSHYALNDRAEELGQLAKSYAGEISAVEQHLKRFPASIDATTNYLELKNRLQAIQP